jgi:hypothetical protein
MHFPHRRIDDRHALDQHILAEIWLNELRPQIVPFAEYTLGNRDILSIIS